MNSSALPHAGLFFPAAPVDVVPQTKDLPEGAKYYGNLEDVHGYIAPTD